MFRLWLYEDYFIAIEELDSKIVDNICKDGILKQETALKSYFSYFLQELG